LFVFVGSEELEVEELVVFVELVGFDEVLEELLELELV
jgi:hypothetical protein